mmetsp:Transcript_71454/g.167299  ORF Transcript_71454/g.167299 Transcript_71454/m.167299 type:complete len:95 (-) Transcript_71454:309-593(-)
MSTMHFHGPENHKSQVHINPMGQQKTASRGGRMEKSRLQSLAPVPRAILCFEACQRPKREHIPECSVRDANGSVEHSSDVLLSPVARSQLALEE